MMHGTDHTLRIIAILSLSIGTALGHVVVLPLPSVVNAATPRYVATTGIDAGSCADHLAPCRTIGYTIDQAVSGDAVIIATGTYSENVTVDKSLSLIGTSIDTTIVDGSRQNSVFTVKANITMTITGMTIQNGAAPTGGGIHNSGILTLTDSLVSNNSAVSVAAIPYGAGIYNAGTLTLNNSSISYNGIELFSGAFCSRGGGLYNADGSTAELNNSTVTGNDCSGGPGPSNLGGGIYNGSGAILKVSTSSITGNIARGAYNGAGGGIYNNGGIVTLINSTISANRVGGRTNDGGGIETVGGTLTLISSTVTENASTPSMYEHGDFGGGIANVGDTSVVLRNTILAGNIASGSGVANDCSGSLVSQGHNVLGDPTNCYGLTNGINNDKVGLSSRPLKPRLGRLQNNGGLTPTHALLAGSPALDAGDNTACPLTDQRGASRPFDGNGDGGAICDIGAVEMQTVVHDLFYLPLIAYTGTGSNLKAIMREFP